MDVIALHLAQSHYDADAGLITCVINGNNKTVQCRPTWSPTINYVQMKDIKGCGYQFRMIPRLGTTQKVGMLTWVLFSIMSSVQELWHAVTTKEGPFHHHCWEGHMIGFIQKYVFSYDTIQNDPRSSFKKISKVSDIVNEVNSHAPIQANIDYESSDPQTFFTFSIDFMSRIFQESDHPTIAVASSVLADILSIEDITVFDEKNIIIVVGHGLLEEVGNDDDCLGKLALDSGATCELCLIVLLRSNDQPNNSNPSIFDSICYMRHGNKYKLW